MLWMLGVVAILVDVVSRFSGGEKAVHHDPVKVVVHTTTTTPRSVEVMMDMLTPPDVEVTYVVIKKGGRDSDPIDNNEIPPLSPIEDIETDKNDDNKKSINNKREDQGDENRRSKMGSSNIPQEKRGEPTVAEKEPPKNKLG